MLPYIDRRQLNLHIRANPADPQIFELSYCATCNRFVPGSGLFPPVEAQPEHSGHALAWLPAVDSPLPPYPSEGHIQHWLAVYGPQLNPAQRRELQNYATVTGSLNWVWLLKGDEQADWLAYLNQYLENLMEAWLAALDGRASAFFPQPATVWRRYSGHSVKYVSGNSEKSISKLINLTVELVRKQ